MTLEIGSVVQLKSGGPAMTIRMIVDSYMTDRFELAAGVHCEWFVGGYCTKYVFHPDQLKPLITEEAPATTET